MRALIVLLLCFVVAFQGIANAHVYKKPCPMEQGQEAAVFMDMSADGHDCCNDADTVSKTGKLCKTDMPYGSSSAYVLPSSRFLLPSSQNTDFVSALQTPDISRHPSGIWRPPTLS